MFELGLDANRLIAAGVLVAFALVYLLSLRSQRKGKPDLRKIPAFAAAERLVDEAAETGGWLHFSPGTAPLGGASTAETLAGLSGLAALVRLARSRGARVRVTTADPLTLVAARGMIEAARRNASAVEPTARAEFLAPEPVAYATGVMGLLGSGRPTGNVMLGSLGDEYLLMGHVGARQGLPQVVGSSVVGSLPFVVTSAQQPVLGEDVFAAAAYMSPDPSQRALLVTRDWARVAIVASLVVLAVLRTAGAV